jgi:maltose O-acetyltransferase
MGMPECVQPVLFLGQGKIKFGENVSIGLRNSKQFYSAYTYFEARREKSEIIIGSNVFFNNSCTFLCENSSINIGDDCLIGPCCEFLDSNFHPLAPLERRAGTHTAKSITLENNVFLGANVIILKGVTIGENSVVGANSVVINDVPKNTIVAGNPAKIIKSLA